MVAPTTDPVLNFLSSAAPIPTIGIRAGRLLMQLGFLTSRCCMIKSEIIKLGFRNSIFSIWN